jgi:ABC-type taurine transport system substrate-binding protein
MYGLVRTTNYNIFKCQFSGCNKNIPVESVLSHNNYSEGISYLQKEGIDLRHDLIAIDVTCPFCSKTNHFRVMDKVREISKQEYDTQSNAVKSNSQRIMVAYKVKTPADS